MMIPYGKQCLDAADIAAVVETLKGDWLTCGPKVAEFEEALAAYCGAGYAIAVANGTAALHVAMLAAGVRKGERVLTSANTFLASANCAEFVGATADFADIDPMTFNVTAKTLAAAWRPDVRAVVPVDFGGQPCEMPAIADLAHSRGALVIEDASHSLGSQFRHEGQWYKVGGHPWADMTTFSFHPVKTITTGEGGAILTNDEQLAARCRLLRSHGMTKDPSQFISRDPGSPASEKGAWYYEMHEVGYNYRITDIQCALGLSQLNKLDRFIGRRAEIVAQYNAAFASHPFLKCPELPAFHLSSFILHPSEIAWHLYVLKIDFAKLGKQRAQVMAELRELGVGTQVHYIPVHLQPYYRSKYGYDSGKCPQTEIFYSRNLSLPLFPAMTDADMHHVVGIVNKVIGGG
jgi:UDP-4-amino-4,6-dideoxy-N-acetyl-beta-L-altrosamine transaminase